MNTLFPEAPPGDVLLLAAIVAALLILAAALFAVMFGRPQAERDSSAEEDLAEQEFALSRPGALGSGYHPAPPRARTR